MQVIIAVIVLLAIFVISAFVGLKIKYKKSHWIFEVFH